MGSSSSKVQLTPEQVTDQYIKSAFIVMFSRTWCLYCKRLKKLLRQLNVDVAIIEVNKHENGSAIMNVLPSISGCQTTPQLFVGGQFVGGSDDVHRLHAEGKFLPLIEERRSSWNK
ncbi:Glutaredoxin domain-containing protein [Plasmodiophora brassicae]|uniref:Glutaredoxin domain-containing protein n=1 Tax=Plasmodiophora brassicae TaxID=37360 RepID=A0A3P3Y7U9_PLABS|nr:unnamed protein product [Plasmodiophora brassicae]